MLLRDSSAPLALLALWDCSVRTNNLKMYRLAVLGKTKGTCLFSLLLISLLFCCVGDSWVLFQHLYSTPIEIKIQYNIVVFALTRLQLHETSSPHSFFQDQYATVNPNAITLAIVV